MKQLTDLYRDKLNLLHEPLSEYNSSVGFGNKATNPFFITTPDDYGSYKNSIMIFGQETNSWCFECGKKSEYSNSLERSLQVYRDFYLNGGINSYRGPFWNEFKRIRRDVQKTKNAVFLWNNINKIGRIGKGNIPKLNEVQFKHLDVIRDEIELLKPTVLIFLTGPDYDHFVKKNIGNFSQKEISDSLWEVTFSDDRFKNLKAFKTYHPNALYFQGKNGTVIPNLIKAVKNECS